MDSKENDINTIILDHTSWDQPNNANEIYISDFDNMLSVSSAAMPTITISDSTGGPYIFGSSGVNWDDTTINGSVLPNNTMQLTGEGADIVVNGESLMDTLKVLKERLNYLRPNPELEAEWTELRELGDRYRQLESQLAEKSKMWDTLKSMPPPEIK